MRLSVTSISLHSFEGRELRFGTQTPTLNSTVIIIHAHLCFYSHYDIFHFCKFKVFSNRILLDCLSFPQVSRSKQAAILCSLFIFPP